MTTPEDIMIIDPAWRVNHEDMGSKPKFWFRHEDTMWLYKQARKNTGEHWAEKVSSEIAELLGLPSHKVRLASYEGKPGCAVRNFLGKRETLIHGNELLSGTVKGYDKEKWRGQSDHNFNNIVTALENAFPSNQARKRASFLFVGYMVLDALVGNTDRHHENWGIIQSPTENSGYQKKSPLRKMAPTFDHGSSLGRELLEDRALRLLDDPDALQRYIHKARGGIFRDSNQKRGMSPLSLVNLIAEQYADFFQPWREKLEKLPDDFAHPLLDKLPESCMSQTSKRFALAFLAKSRTMIASIS